MRSRLKQKPAAMIGPTVIGLWALFLAVMSDNLAVRVIGAVTFMLGVVLWVMAFTVTPKSRKPPSPPALVALVAVAALAASTLTACEGLPPSPTPRLVNGVTIIDNPPYMNAENLGILRYWYVYTHPPVLPIIDLASVPTDDLLDVSTTATVTMPANVVMARAAWFDTGGLCAAGILVTGGQVVFTVANPPAGLGATIVTWAFNLGGGALSLASCWDTFMWSVENDASSRWLLSCRDAYLTGNDWNMLDPGWVPSNVVKWQQCIVFGWAAMRAATLGVPVDDNGIATLSNLICTDEIIPRCYWA